MDRLGNLEDIANLGGDIKEYIDPEKKAYCEPLRGLSTKTLGAVSEDLMPSKESRTAN